MEMETMTLIEVKYLSATRTMGDRLKCDMLGKSKTEPQRFITEPHEQALRMAYFMAKSQGLSLCGTAQSRNKDKTIFICK